MVNATAIVISHQTTRTIDTMHVTCGVTIVNATAIVISHQTTHIIKAMHVHIDGT